MWKVRAFEGGAWRDVPITTIDGKPFSSQTILDSVLGRDGNTRLIEYLSQEVSQPLGKREAIEHWASSAADDSREFEWASPTKIEAFEHALALSPRSTSPDSRPFTMAWHDRTAVIIPFTGREHRINVEYVPSLRDEQRIERLRDRYATVDHSLETVLEWRGYFGDTSAVIDYWTSMRKNGRGFVASIAGTAGFCVGSVFRRLKRPQPMFEKDPLRQSRLVRMLEQYPHIDSGCPDLATTRRVAHQHAMVFVHGAISCGVQGLKDLYPPPAPAWPVYRFEHDTFRSLDENAKELAGLIRERLEVPRLLIAGHSRGGLVARAAAALLANAHQGLIEIYTFGTPYQGTPLAAIGGKFLNLLFKLGEDFAGAIPLVSPLAKAYGYLCDSPTLPPGIEVLREDSAALAMLDMIGDRYPVRSWGSSFDINQGPSGFGVGIEGILAGSLNDRAHDLVVPTASALGAGTVQQPVLNCSHVHYFTQPSVRKAIQAFFVPPAAGHPPAVASKRNSPRKRAKLL